MRFPSALLGLLMVVGAASADKLTISYAEMGVTFTVDVDMTDTVWTLKDLIHDKYSSAPVDDQELTDLNYSLYNLRTLGSYHLKDGDILLLEVHKDSRRPVQPRPEQTITVEWPQRESYFIVQAEMTDTVRSIKGKIHDKWPSIQVDNELLIRGSEILADERTLKSYGLKDKAKIRLELSRYDDPLVGPKSSKKVFIKSPQMGVYFHLDVEMTDTVWAVKDKIHDLLPWAPIDDQELMHDTYSLYNTRTLSSYAMLKDGDTLLLQVEHDEHRRIQPKPVQKINVKWDQSETHFIIQVNLTDTVLSLKEKIHQKWPAIDVDKEILVYNNNVLSDDKTLKSQGLRDGSDISLNVLEYDNHQDKPETAEKLSIRWIEEQVDFVVNIKMSEKVQVLREKIHEKQPLIAIEGQKLTYGDTHLANYRTLDSYNLKDGDIILLEAP